MISHVMNEEEIKNFFMHHIHESHLAEPIDQKVDEENKQAVFTYPLDKGSCQRVYKGWAYTIYLS